MAKILVVEARFYEDLGERFYKNIKAELEKAKLQWEYICLAGALEVPGAIAYAANKGIYDGYLALGIIIRGDTIHYDIVCKQSARGLMDLSIHNELAIINAIQTVENKEQALERIDSKAVHAVHALSQLLKAREQIEPSK
ncbi:MAG: 6,7-dimethyl-8-ribityllumazine synthase [Parvibaculales bacterium]